MTESLRAFPGEFDFVHLSNILDWLNPAEARATLELACAALRRDGWILVRQLNSTLDVRGLGAQFAWHADRADALHARDRSYFYRALHLGRKR
jgi:S-adenosylmethionine-diacylglycerol 3-amino-3-carboxypropyl transferase